MATNAQKTMAKGMKGMKSSNSSMAQKAMKKGMAGTKGKARTQAVGKKSK